MIATTTNPVIMVLASMGFFIMQLFAFLAIMFIIVVAVGWPIKMYVGSIKNIIRRAGR